MSSSFYEKETRVSVATSPCNTSPVVFIRGDVLQGLVPLVSATLHIKQIKEKHWNWKQRNLLKNKNKNKTEGIDHLNCSEGQITDTTGSTTGLKRLAMSHCTRR